MSFCAGFFEFFADKVQRGQLVEFGPDFRLGFAVEAVDVGTYLSGIPLGQAVAVDDFGGEPDGSIEPQMAFALFLQEFHVELFEELLRG